MASPSDNGARESWLARLGTLGDLTRLRVLRLLERQELGVGELSRAMRMPQSSVSRHLKALFDAGFVQKRSEGTATLYVLHAAALDPDARSLWQLTRGHLGSCVDFDEDDARLAEVLSERRTDSRTFFGQIGGRWDRLRDELFGDRFTAPALLALLDASCVVADVGCGTGEATELLAPFVAKVVAIDRERAMLDAARRRMSDATNVEFREGDLARLPAKAGEFDAAIAMLVLHHVEDVEGALRELGRIVRSGGAVVVVDMVAHGHAEFRVTMGHQHLGFSETDLARAAKAAGLKPPRYRRLRVDTERKGPGLFAASFRKA
ncbi:MAG: metalloregulator ArsR/SmtB family transcription factor [Phycisphaerales bacterium]